MLKTPVFKVFLPIPPLRRFAPAPPSVGEPWMVQQPYKLEFEYSPWYYRLGKRPIEVLFPRRERRCVRRNHINDCLWQSHHKKSSHSPTLDINTERHNISD